MDPAPSPSLFGRALRRHRHERPASGSRRRRAASALAGCAAVVGGCLLAAPGVAGGTSAPSPAHQRATLVSRAVPASAPRVHGAALSEYPIVGAAPTPDGQGYWLVASNGGVFTFGDAAFYGSLGGVHLSQPIVGMAATPGGGGYWLVASDGGVFSFGDAAFYGSTGDVHLAKPIVGMAATPGGGGYWLVASDGGVFSFGAAHFYGSTGAVRLVRPVVAMAATPGGGGYWLVASDGGVFTFGDAPFGGSAVSFDAAAGAVTVGLVPVGSGYWVPTNQGTLLSIGTPAPASSSVPVFNQTAPPAPPSPSQLPANQNPSRSLSPSLAYQQSCWGSTPDVAACNTSALSDIDSARAGEGLGPLVLPAGFYSMNADQQVLAVANAERTSRGLPALPESAGLDALAQNGAVQGRDPTGPYGYTWGSNIAWGDATALAADFGWMYDDGPNSPNIDCTSPGDAGCWGHRENILSPWAGASGAGNYDNGGMEQLTELFVQNY